MKTLAAIAATLILVSFNARADISDLDWMTGCWAQVGRAPGSIEQWSSPAGGMMLGFSRIARTLCDDGGAKNQ